MTTITILYDFRPVQTHEIQQKLPKFKLEFVVILLTYNGDFPRAPFISGLRLNILSTLEMPPLHLSPLTSPPLKMNKPVKYSAEKCPLSHVMKTPADTQRPYW